MLSTGATLCSAPPYCARLCAAAFIKKKRVFLQELTCRLHESKWQTRWMSSSGIIHQAAVLSSSAWRWALKTSSYKSNEWFILFEVWFIVKIIIQLSWDLVIMFVSHDPDLQSAWVYMNWAVTFIIIIQAQECTVPYLLWQIVAKSSFLLSSTHC